MQYSLPKNDHSKQFVIVKHVWANMYNHEHAKINTETASGTIPAAQGPWIPYLCGLLP